MFCQAQVICPFSNKLTKKKINSLWLTIHVGCFSSLLYIQNQGLLYFTQATKKLILGGMLSMIVRVSW